MTREVIIEAKVLEVTLSADYQAGIDWSLLEHHKQPRARWAVSRL